MKKLLFSCMAIIALAAFAAMAPPMSASAAGLYAPVDIGQVHAQSISDPYNGDIAGDLAVSPLEKYALINPDYGDGGSAILDFGTTAVLSAKAPLLKGGGFFGTGSES